MANYKKEIVTLAMINKESSLLIGKESQSIEGKNFVIRTIAALLDCFIMYGSSIITTYMLSIFLAAIVYLIALSTGKIYYFEKSQPQIINLAYTIITSIFYFAVFEGLFGSTVGKLLFKIRVISEDGSSCSLKQAFVRSFYRLIDVPGFSFIAYKYMKPPSYQRLGDIKAATLVVSSSNPIIKDYIPSSKFFTATLYYLLFSTFVQLVWLLFFLRFS